MNREMLERPFEANLIKSRRGHHGKTFSYVEGSEYIRRLNEAFDGEWSFEIVEYQILENDVFVIGKLSTQGIVKTSFGGTSITRNHHTGEATNLADDLKAASTDALKKASSLFGLGLHHHSDTSNQQDDRAKRQVGSGPKSITQGKLTDRQLTAIQAISRSLGWSREALSKHCQETYNALPKELVKSDASALIDELRHMSMQAAA